MPQKYYLDDCCVRNFWASLSTQKEKPCIMAQAPQDASQSVVSTTCQASVAQAEQWSGLCRRKISEKDMRRQRATSADRLSQVIEVIALGRRTGLLSIERTDQAGLEEGDIYFVNGEAIYASTGMQGGRAALETLSTWGACRFAFLADIPRPVPNITPELRGARSSQAGSIRRPVTGSRPLASQPEPSAPLAGPSSVPKGAGLSAGESASTLWLPVLMAYHRPKRAPNPQDIPRLAASYGLSWAHRALLLLADGEHTVAQLARLSGRSEEEVARLLSDLLRLSLITLLS